MEVEAAHIHRVKEYRTVLQASGFRSKTHGPSTALSGRFSPLEGVSNGLPGH